MLSQIIFRYSARPPPLHIFVVCFLMICTKAIYSVDVVLPFFSFNFYYLWLTARFCFFTLLYCHEWWLCRANLFLYSVMQGWFISVHLREQSLHPQSTIWSYGKSSNINYDMICLFVSWFFPLHTICSTRPQDKIWSLPLKVQGCPHRSCTPGSKHEEDIQQKVPN